jgi:D-aminopeptidase
LTKLWAVAKENTICIQVRGTAAPGEALLGIPRILQAGHSSTQSETLRLRVPITDDTFKASITRIRRISSNVTREIELHHRLELKMAHRRLIKVERTQQSIVAAMEDQRKILASMAEVRRLVTMMKDQQVILQAVQQLQLRLLTPNQDIGSQNESVQRSSTYHGKHASA